MTKRIVFDVGANDGKSTRNTTFIINSNPVCIINTKDPNCTTYRFEPTPRLAAILKADPYPNLVTVEAAVSDFEGMAEFHITGSNDWGASSLLEFSEKSKTHWKGNPFFEVTETIQVKVIRLDKFIEENGIDRIDYFHCDTQGSDLAVLRGMGRHINIITQGIIECANEGKDDILYKGQNTLKECKEFLISNGFKIMNIQSNERYYTEPGQPRVPLELANEVNIEFINENA